MQFITEQHEKNYNELIKKGNIGSDVERESLFYIIAGNMELYKNVQKIYNFKEKQIRIELGEDGEFYIPNLPVSSSAKKLANLGVQLFNGTIKQSVISTFAGLDNNNFNLAINAIKIRFQM